MEYPLYSHVHHGFGLNDAFDASVGLLSLQVCMNACMCALLCMPDVLPAYYHMC